MPTRASKEKSEYMAVSAVSAVFDTNVDYEGIFVGSPGDVSVIFYFDSAAVILKNVPAGTFLPIHIKQITTANTTATDIVAFN